VGPYIGLGLCLSSRNDVAGGLKEIRAAQHLYPDRAYIHSEALPSYERLLSPFFRDNPS